MGVLPFYITQYWTLLEIEALFQKNKWRKRIRMFQKNRKLKHNRQSSRMLLVGILALTCVVVLVLLRAIQRGKSQVGQESVSSPEKAKKHHRQGAVAQGGEETEAEEPGKGKEESVQAASPEPVEALSQEAIGRLAAGSVIDTSAMTAADIGRLFYSQEIPEEVFSRMDGVSYQENENIIPEDLRYLRLLHVGFDGQTHIGELIVNSRISAEILAIFRELYAKAYPIEKMLLIDEYQADDSLSMADNNSSAFNYRVIAGTDRLSKHSLGMAVDINPKYNPYIRTGEEGETVIEPEGSEAYIDRTADFKYKIDETDLAYQLFTRYGFAWGGDWKTLKDYQHFEKEE